MNDIGLLGAVINLNASAGVNNFSQGHNLHKLTFTNASLTIPIIPPACQSAVGSEREKLLPFSLTADCRLKRH